jgi:hypothetical protein
MRRCGKGSSVSGKGRLVIPDMLTTSTGIGFFGLGYFTHRRPGSKNRI